jgi:hypothetical protein
MQLSLGEEAQISILEIISKEEMMWIASKAVPFEDFPPCIKNMIQRNGCERGRHRISAILAAFFGQIGWNEDEAKQHFPKDVPFEERIFTQWFRKMHCPKCETLKKDSRGYPDLGIADLDFCQSIEKCEEYQGPVEYAAKIKTDQDRSTGRYNHINTLHIARIFNWRLGREGKIELSRTEKDKLEKLLLEKKENEAIFYTRAKVRGRIRPKFFLKDMEGAKKKVLSELM